MADDVTQTVNTIFTQKGAEALIKQLRSAQTELDELRRSGQLTEDGFARLTRQMNKAEQAAQKGAGAWQKWSNVQKEFGAQTSTVAMINKNLTDTINKQSEATRKAAQSQNSLNAARAAAKSNEIGGRNYNNASVQSDAAIAQRERESKQFASALRAQMMAQTQATAVTKQAVVATRNHAESLPRLRYALYDVSATAAITGTAMLALATATVAASVKMDRDFADVVRTTGTYLDTTGVATKNLRDDFNDLFSTLPASWADLTDIGTLAGQLGVPQQNIAEFTKLVAMFAATTDVSVDQAATAFGRLSELLDVSASQYNNLGSSILAVGVASVATESQIINTSTQIASIGNFAGFSADEVIGLSSALASLGTQPELARGTVTRLFTNIDTAIAQGGERLELFGKLAGKTGAEFAQAWEDDAAGALQLFLNGLGSISGDGGQAIQTLKELGITAARDVPTILRLAQNHELLAEQMQIATNGFAQGSALQDQYGVISETVAAKLEVLKNNIQLLVATLGDSTGALANIIDGITTLVRGLTELSDNSAVQAIAGITIGLTALAGVSLIVVGGLARMTASGLAVRTAMIDAAVATGTYATAAEAAAAGNLKLALSMNAVRKTLIGTGIGAALVVIGTAIAYFVGESEKAKQKLDDLQASYEGTFQSGTTDELREAEGIIRILPDTLGDAATASDNNATAARNLASEYLGLTDGVETTTGAVDNYVTAMTEATQLAAQQNLMDWFLGEGDGAEQLQRVNDIREGMRLLGVTREQLVTAITTGDMKFFSDLEVQSMLAMEAAAEEAGYSVEFYDSATASAIGAMQNLADEGKTQTDAFTSGAKAAQASAAANQLLGLSADGSAGDMEELTDGVKTLTEGMFDLINSEMAVIGATYDLGSAMAQNGSSFSEFTAGGRANIQALQQAFEAAAAAAGSDTALYGSLVANIINQLVAAGATGVAQLGFVQQALTAKGTAVTNAVANNLLGGQIGQGMAAGFQKAGKAAGGAAKKVRTLLDYVSDLSKVMDDAFDFRFGFEQSTDDVIASFRDIETAFEDARQKVRDLTLAIQEYQAEISGLSSDIGILEYHLTIAEEYNDTLRATAIRAELEKANAKLAKTQADLADSQGDLSKANQEATPDLESSTDASIEQRKAVLDLIETYQDQIEAYAATGASQQQIAQYTTALKQRFEEQLRSVGYAEASIRRYSVAFDDFRKIVERVPRNLTVSVDADPAIRALDEYNAHLKNVQGTVAAGGFSPAFNDDAMQKMARGLALQARLAVLLKAQQSPTGTLAYYQSLAQQIAAISAQLNSGSYMEGGYTGAGRANEPAGIVHRGEYVVPAKQVNQRTGLPYADQYHRLSNGVSGGPGYQSGGYVAGRATGPVDLSMMTMQQLQQMFRVDIYLDSKKLASSMSNQFASSTRVGGS